MNANRIINMVIRMVVNRLVRTGVNAGINAAGKRMSKGKDTDPQGGKDNAPQTAETQKRMRQSIRAARKIGRF